MTCKQLLGWQAYATIEPFGPSRIELKLARIEQFLYNRYRDSDRKPEPFDLEDFAPWIRREEEKELSQEEIQEKIDREVFGL